MIIHNLGRISEATECLLRVLAVKSLRAVSLQQVTVDNKGLAGDRRFMVVVPRSPSLTGSFSPDDATYQFLTQRQCPSLATITASIHNDSLTLSSPLATNKTVTIYIKKAMLSGGCMKARIWGDTTEVLDMGDKAAAFLASVAAKDSEMTPKNVKKIRLVSMKRDDRMADEKYTPRAALSWTGALPKVSLADGFPISIVGQGSLDELNQRLKKKGKEQIPMSRFRPNIVISGTRPFEEDTWTVISIGGVVFHLVKGCPRCKESCTDQETGKVSDEPVATLSEFRALGPVKENVYFAQNAVAHEEGGVIKVGAPVWILERGEPVWDT